MGVMKDRMSDEDLCKVVVFRAHIARFLRQSLDLTLLCDMSISSFFHNSAERRKLGMSSQLAYGFSAATPVLTSDSTDQAPYRCQEAFSHRHGLGVPTPACGELDRCLHISSIPNMLQESGV